MEIPPHNLLPPSPAFIQALELLWHPSNRGIDGVFDTLMYRHGPLIHKHQRLDIQSRKRIKQVVLYVEVLYLSRDPVRIVGPFTFALHCWYSTDTKLAACILAAA
jgi:hypothetical protein